MTDTTLEILISATVHCPVCNKSVTRADLTPAQAQLQPLAVAELVLAGQAALWGRSQAAACVEKSPDDA